jgi:hypothetical protein
MVCVQASHTSPFRTLWVIGLCLSATNPVNNPALRPLRSGVAFLHVCLTKYNNPVRMIVFTSRKHLNIMESKMEIVKPVVENGIEFYCSADGTQRGISQVGCSRLCGVPESSLRLLIQGFVVRSNSVPESLEHLVGADLYLAVTSAKQAKVLDSKVVASLVAYYAFDKGNEVAKYSLSKFASMGIDRWIETVTGYTESSDSIALLNSLNATMGKMMVKLEKLERIEEETLGYRKATVTLPVLEKWMQELTDEAAAKLLAPAEETFTIKEAVNVLFPGTTFSTTMLKKLALKVSQIISGLSDRPNLKKSTPNGKGYSMQVNAYTKEQLPLIKLCLQSIMGEY